MATVILSGGYAHDFGASSAALAALLGGDCRIETDVARAVAALPETSLLVVNALRWTMSQDVKYEPHRSMAYDLGDAAMTALESFVASGGTLLAMHTATICFDTQPGWTRLLGGGWRWGHSWHAPLGAGTVTVDGGRRWLGTSLADFETVDEFYCNLDPDASCAVVATMADQPLAWVRRHGDGRVAVDALGHDAAAMTVPGHAALALALSDWLAA